MAHWEGLIQNRLWPVFTPLGLRRVAA